MRWLISSEIREEGKGNMSYRLVLFLIVVALLLGLMIMSAFGQGTEEGVDLRQGAVFGMSNARAADGGNVVVAFSRAADGTLTRVGSFPTGGAGSGSFEDTANGLVLGSAEGESSPNNLIEDNELLFVTNAGSNTITVFRVRRNRLQRVEIQNSGGEKPVSITVNRGLVYVLNSGEFNDDLNVTDPPNCTTGRRPSVTGFTVSTEGQLTPIPDSTRLLSGDSFSGCAQVSFNPTGDLLVVTERVVRTERSQVNNGIEGVIDEGVIVTFRVNDDGTLSGKRVIDATGQGPFGFTFTKDGILLTTEQFDGPLGPGRGAATSYALNNNGTLKPLSGSVDNGGTDTCWFVVTDDGQLGFTVSFFDTGRISSYRITPEGNLELIQAVAADAAETASDLALSHDSKYLYNVIAAEGTINAYEVGSDGSLTLIQTVQALEPSPEMEARIGLAAF